MYRSGITVFARWNFFVDLGKHSDFRWFGIKIRSTLQIAFQNVRMNVSAREQIVLFGHHLLPKTDMSCVLCTRLPDEMFHEA